MMMKRYKLRINAIVNPAQRFIYVTPIVITMSLDKVVEGYMNLHDNIDHLLEFQINAKIY